jgi:hypothetical protein
MSHVMNTEQSNREGGVSWSRKEELWRELREIEDLVDRVALRIGDALFGARTSEKIFGPHPSQF